MYVCGRDEFTNQTNAHDLLAPGHVISKNKAHAVLHI